VVEERVGAGVGVGHKAVGRVVLPVVLSVRDSEENHSGKGETRIGGGSFGVFPGLWTMVCD